MAYVGVREPPVRLVIVRVKWRKPISYLGIDGDAWAVNQLTGAARLGMDRRSDAGVCATLGIGVICENQPHGARRIPSGRSM